MVTKERPTREDGRSATPRRMFRAGDAAVLLSYVPADDSRDVTVLTDVWTRDGGYTDNGCCDVRFRDGRVRRVYSGALVYPSPVCAESAQAAVEEQTMDHDTTYSAIEKLSPRKGDIVFIRADSDSIDHDSARHLRKALGAEGFAGLLIVGGRDVSIQLLDEEKMKKYGWVKHDLRG